MTTYIIKSDTEKDDETGECLYWISDFGWGDRIYATLYPESVKENYDPPLIGGSWEKNVQEI